MQASLLEKGETRHMKDDLGVSPYGLGVSGGVGRRNGGREERENERKGHSDVLRPQCLQDAKKEKKAAASIN